MKNLITYSVRCHIGKVRTNNEDNFFANGVTLPQNIDKRCFSLDGVASAPVVFAVCDGMGGEEDGEIASRLAVDMLSAYQTQLSGSPKLTGKAVQTYVKEANHAIRMETCGKRAGTTLALAVISPHGAQCFNMGDSRVYCLKRDVFRQVTHDHTLGAEQKRRNLGFDGDCSSYGHQLTRCVGIGDRQEAEQYAPVTGSYRLLLCSDGLTNMVNDRELEQALSSNATPVEIADTLLACALERGGRDNITILVVDVKTRSLFGLC